MKSIAATNFNTPNGTFNFSVRRLSSIPTRLERLKAALAAAFVCSFLMLSLKTSFAGIIVTPPPTRNCDIDIGDVSNGPPDPGALGPFTVAYTEYNFGDSAAHLPDFEEPVEFRARITYPLELSCGPFPIVFMMHGSHATCLSSTSGVAQHWPCTGDETVLPNYRGYNYFADRLASHGFITVSISANGINGSPNTKNFSLDARAELIDKHITLWKSLATTGAFPYGDMFTGKVDLSRIGLMGHSRGGGVARYLDLSHGFPIVSLTSGTTPNFLKTKVKAVLLIGAVEGDDQPTLEITDTALATLYPYCDGDQETLPSVAYYDASRYALSGDKQPKHSFLILGANHNYFNTYWDDTLPVPTAGSKDDWFYTGDAYCDAGNPLNSRLSSAEQRASLIAVGSAFFRTYLKNEKAFLPFLRAEAGPPPSAQTDGIYVAYQPKDAPESRLDVNRLTSASNLSINTLGGPVLAGGLTRFEFCDVLAEDGPNGCLSDVQPAGSLQPRRPHDFSEAPATQLRIAWNSNRNPLKPAFINELPEEKRNISAFKAFQFRALVDFSDPLNPFGLAQNLRVALRDGAGLSASVAVAGYSPALYFPPSDGDPSSFDDPVPRAVLNTVRVPLSAFQDIFLTDIRRVELIFDQTTTGAINIADLAFADEAANKPPQIDCALTEPVLNSGGSKLINVGLDVTTADDNDQDLPAEVLVYSDEDDVNSNPHQYSPDAKDLALETLRLRGEYDKNGDGRVYLVLVKAHDDQGAIGHACCTASVPAGKTQPAIDQALAQAAEAEAMCTAFAAASEGLKSLPNGFFVVGDGPVIGPDQ